MNTFFKQRSKRSIKQKNILAQLLTLNLAYLCLPATYASDQVINQQTLLTPVQNSSKQINSTEIRLTTKYAF